MPPPGGGLRKGLIMRQRQPSFDLLLSAIVGRVSSRVDGRTALGWGGTVVDAMAKPNTPWAVHPQAIAGLRRFQRTELRSGSTHASVLLHTRRSDRLPRRLWPIVQSHARCPTAVWREPDQGISEARGKPQHYVSSKLMGWVALDRASKLAEIRGDSDLAATWQATAAEIKDDILAHSVDNRGVLRQHYDTDALDASTLLAAIFGFLPPTTSGSAQACSPSPTN